MPATEQIVAVRSTASDAPRLSVLTPFRGHDPSALLMALADAPAGVEFVLLDDGSGSASLLAQVIAATETLGAPARIIVWGENQGRAAARNRLIDEARGDYVLFLDADMLPDSPHFLSIWLGIIDTQAPRAAFGGLSLAQARRTAETALHYALISRSDCRNARTRARRPAQSTATANLLVLRTFLGAHPFDAGFTGWGFEDVDWALRASHHAEILHVDNPATHAGLDDISTLMRKLAEAGPNFARLARKHPAQVSRFAAHRIARAVRATPARQAQRRLYSWIARDPLGAAPMRVRCTALKLLRASHYAEHLK
ncbi:MAG: glycosyltransferase family 2 protein [Caulobacteraceae bacterium]